MEEYNEIIALIAGIGGLVGLIWKGSPIVYRCIFPKKVKIYENNVDSLFLNTLNPKNFSNIKPYYLACKNRSFVKNETNKAVLINRGVLSVEKYEKLEHTEIVLQQGLYKEYLDIYLINNGDLESKELNFKMELTLSKQNNGTQISEEVSDKQMLLFTNEEPKKKAKFIGGQIIRMYHIDTTDRVKKFFRENPNYSSLNFHLMESNDELKFQIFSITYNKEQDKFTYGGLGGGATLIRSNIVELDLDSMNEEQEIPNISVNVPAESTAEISTIVVAKSSIKLKYKIHYYVEGKKIPFPVRDSFEAEVYVPLYNITSNYPNGDLFKKLCEYNITNYTYEETTRILHSIKYDYKSIYNQISE